MDGSKKSLKTVFGFLNRNENFPSELITVVMDGNDYYEVHPTGAHYKLTHEATGQPVTQEEISAREKFIPHTAGMQSPHFKCLTSFAVSASRIIIGTPANIAEGISNENEIDLDQHTGEDLKRLIEAHRGMEDFLAGKTAPKATP